MTFCCGRLGWSPREVWESTFYEISCAYVGYCQKEGEGFTQLWSDADRADYEEMKRRFPDHPGAGVEGGAQ